MPRISLQDPWGMGYQITSSREETIKAWFDEILPIVNHSLGQRDVPPARIFLGPMFTGPDGLSEPDWLCDTRVTGAMYEFRWLTGEDGMEGLRRLRMQLEDELSRMP